MFKLCPCIRTPKCVVPKLMNANGELVIVFQTNINIKSTNGRIILNGWRKLMKVHTMKTRDMMIFVLHHGRARNFIFLAFMPAEPDEE